MAQRTMTKKERREAARAARREAQRRARRRRLIRSWAIPLGVIAAIALIAFVTTMEGGEPEVGEVEVSGPPRQAALQAGEAFPEFSATGLEGGEVSWGPGEPSLIAIWAPWCPICQEEIPMIDRLATDYPDLRIVTVATAVDDRPGPTVSGFVEDEGITLPVGLDDAAGTLARAMGIRGFPTLYLVDAEGAVVTAAEGQVGEAALRGALDELVGGAG